MHARKNDPPPVRFLEWVGCALLLLPAAMLARAGEDELDPAQVPWEQIEAWALAKTEKNPFRNHPDANGKELATTSPAAVSPDPKTVKGPATTERPPDAVAQPDAKPAYVSVPGRRRQEPQVCGEVRRKVKMVMEERLKTAIQYKRLSEAWDFCFRMEEYERSVEYLWLMLQDSKRWQEQRDDGWIKGRLWETALLLPKNRPSLEQIGLHFEEWRKKSQERLDRMENNIGWVRTQKDNEVRAFKKQEAYYKGDSKDLAEVFKDLESRGDADPAALAELCARLSDHRPFAPMRYACVLYKLREWFPDAALVKSGEVQARLLFLLDRDLYLYKEAAEEGDRLMEANPEHQTVTGGDAMWYTAENRVRQGNEMPKRSGTDVWSEARKLFQEYQKKYPNHWGNQVKMPPDPSAGKTQCQLNLWSIERNLRGK